jgi:A/G-specific adenine glycosylase
MTTIPPPHLRRRLHRQLSAWFAREQRPFPWRHNRNVYRIWVSEVMLQQTQAATVVPYFQRFLSAFPSLADLAAAEEQGVFRLWEGLGYYRRARNLHRAAKEIMSAHGGRFPRDPAAAVRLPGLGRYMVGAILSQAFDTRLPILEANSRRVLCRLFAIREDPTSGKTRSLLWQIAEELLPRKRVGDFNQALMELGATVCTPRNPRCGACPLRKDCAASRLGLQSRIPTRRKRPDGVDVREAAVVVRRGGRVLLVQRPDNGRWAGFWEFPHGVLDDEESPADGAVRLVKQLTSLRVGLGAELLTVRHSVTHHRITLTCFEATYVSGVFKSDLYSQGKWVHPARLGEYPVSSPQRQLARAVAGEKKGTEGRG